nr:MAG TPA: hypothetical protein [Caudoviricetes sp.]
MRSPFSIGLPMSKILHPPLTNSKQVIVCIMWW